MRTFLLLENLHVQNLSTAQLQPELSTRPLSASNHLAAITSIIVEYENAAQSRVELEAKVMEDEVVIKTLSDHRDLLLAEVRLLTFAQQSCLEAGAKSNDETIRLRHQLAQYEIDTTQLRGELAEMCKFRFVVFALIFKMNLKSPQGFF